MKRKKSITGESPLVQANVCQYFYIHVNDYHNFDDIKRSLKNIGLNYKYEEIDSEQPYFALFWLGDKPENLANKS